MEPPYYGTEEQSVGSKIKNNIIELIEFVAIIAAVLIVIRFFIAEPHKVYGSSMVPNFHDGDYIITNKISLRFSLPQRGEVIILQSPRDIDKVFIKRVVGLPGEKIKIADGKVYINDAPLAEPYLPQGLQTNAGSFIGENEEIIIPAGQYFVLGDNRGGSSDSREFGPIKVETIIGQALIRYWPIQKFNILKIGSPSS